MKALVRFALMAAIGLAFLASPRAFAQPINEDMFVPIGGIAQWITIKGDDRNNPVVLNLHGGPGDAISPFAAAMYAGWEKEFTLVQWDQRGAGRTFAKTGPSIAPTMTMARMTDDGIEVTEFLTKHLGKKKIILTGGSWGSILGIHMVRARPDLFYAYVGLAQVVNMQKSLAIGYARVLALARSAGDQQPVAAALTAIGPPPWKAISTLGKFLKIERVYQSRLTTARPPPEAIDPAYASPQEQAQRRAADDFSFEHFVGLDLSGPLMKVDLAAEGTRFSIPVFIIQGQEDLRAPPELAKTYLDSITALQKQFFLVPGTGHEPSAAELNLARKILVVRVRPLAGG